MQVALLFVALGAGFATPHPSTRAPTFSRMAAPRDGARTLAAVSVSPPPPSQVSGQRAPAVNVGLLNLLLANQALIALPTFLLGGWEALVEHGDFDQVTTLALGAAGALPLIAASNVLSASRDERTIPINWATNLLSLKLFGLRQEPLVAGAVCLLLGAVVGTVEETAFRGLMLPAIADQLGGGGLALATAIGTTSALFAALHLNPLKLAKARALDGSDVVALALQLWTGSWFALLYAIPGGNLGIPIVAHALYDAFVMWSTHLEVSSQYAYAKAEVRADEKHTPKAVREWSDALGPKFVRDAEYLYHFLDADRSQTIELYELLVGLHAYGLELRADELNARWDACGAPGDPITGALDLEHFVAFVARLSADLSAARAQIAAAQAQTNGLRDEGVGGLETKGLLGVRPTQ